MYRFSPNRGMLARWILTFVAIVPFFRPDFLRAADVRTPFAKLLPGDTLVYVHVPNAQSFRDQWWETSTGRMAQDPQFKPLLDQTFAAGEKAFEPLREKFGLSLAEWLTLPKGELGFAIVPVDGADPAAVLMLEAADDDRSIALMLERGRDAALAAGMLEESESVGDVQLTIFRTSAGKSREVLYLRRDGKLVIGSNRDVIKRILELWSGDGVETFAENPTFANIERLVGRAENAPTDFLWYVDPLDLIRHSTQSNTSVQVGLAILPALGLDGLAGVGGSMAFNRGAFELIGQAYVLLDVPRSGIIELIALRPTPPEPESWVFDALTSYNTFSWDIERSYHQLGKLINTFQGEGKFQSSFRDPLKKETDLDIETDVIPQLTGRVSFIVANELPIGPSSRGHLFGFEFGDEAKAEKLVRHISERYRERWTVVAHGGREYYRFVPKVVEEPIPDPNRPARPRRQESQAAYCQLGKYILFAERPSLIERAIDADGDASRRLAGSLDYKLIASKAKRYAGQNGPGYFAFMRPVEELRFVHGLAQSERVREQIAKGAEKNVFLQDFQQALTDRPLPPFEVLERYFAPGGTIIVDEPTGIRYLSFILKRND